MGLKFFDFIRPKKGKTNSVEIAIHEFCEAAEEYQIRNLCWMICVDMIANAIGKCEFRTYRNHEEIKEDEYYLWNFEPNINQNSSQFLHKLIYQLMYDGETLVIDTKSRKGKEMLVVADSFETPEIYPAKQCEYKGIRVGEVEYKKTFQESDVLHIALTHMNLRDVVNGMYKSYYRMYDAAVRAYTWGQGQHWKVHVNQMASSEEGWTEKFQNMIQDQIKPFLDSNGAILPEFDGYQYEEVISNKSGTKVDSRDIKALVEDIFEFTARGFLIPAVLVNGKVEAVADANARFLTFCIDPLADQLQEEITRKRYGLEEWKKGNFIVVDTSTLLHFDLFANATNIEKLVGSGVYTINDIRRAANQATIKEDWADQHFMTLNIVPMGEAVNAITNNQKGGKI